MEICLGASVAVLVEDDGLHVLAIQRDDSEGIRFAGKWEMPGGGREPGETEEECALRETAEEVGIVLTAEDIIWRAFYPTHTADGKYNAFYVARLKKETVIQSARLGDEGQRFQLMPVTHFLQHPEGVPDHQNRLLDYLGSGALAATWH